MMQEISPKDVDFSYIYIYTIYIYIQYIYTYRIYIYILYAYISFQKAFFFTPAIFSVSEFPFDSVGVVPSIAGMNWASAKEPWI